MIIIILQRFFLIIIIQEPRGIVTFSPSTGIEPSHLSEEHGPIHATPHVRYHFPQSARTLDYDTGWDTADWTIERNYYGEKVWGQTCLYNLGYDERGNLFFFSTLVGT